MIGRGKDIHARAHTIFAAAVSAAAGADRIAAIISVSAPPAALTLAEVAPFPAVADRTGRIGHRRDGAVAIVGDIGIGPVAVIFPLRVRPRTGETLPFGISQHTASAGIVPDIDPEIIGMFARRQAQRLVGDENGVIPVRGAFVGHRRILPGANRPRGGLIPRISVAFERLPIAVVEKSDDADLAALHPRNGECRVDRHTLLAVVRGSVVAPHLLEFGRLRHRTEHRTERRDNR